MQGTETERRMSGRPDTRTSTVWPVSWNGRPARRTMSSMSQSHTLFFRLYLAASAFAITFATVLSQVN